MRTKVEAASIAATKVTISTAMVRTLSRIASLLKSLSSVTLTKEAHSTYLLCRTQVTLQKYSVWDYQSRTTLKIRATTLDKSSIHSDAKSTWVSEHRTHRVSQSNATLVSQPTSSTHRVVLSLHLTTKRTCTIISATSAKSSTTVTLHREMVAQSITFRPVWDLYLGKTSRITRNSIQIKEWIEIFQRLQVTKDSIPIARIGTGSIQAIMGKVIQTRNELVLSVVVHYQAQETTEVATTEVRYQVINMFTTLPEEAMQMLHLITTPVRRTTLTMALLRPIVHLMKLWRLITMVMSTLICHK